MAISFGKGLLVLLLTLVATLAISQAAQTFVVGGSDGWRYGYNNYTDWAFKQGLIFLHDKLVFKYPPPGDNVQPHSVYLLPYLDNFLRCDFSGATLLAGPNQGGGDGFVYEITQQAPNYFASKEGDDCSNGMMKMAVIPVYIPPGFP